MFLSVSNPSSIGTAPVGPASEGKSASALHFSAAVDRSSELLSCAKSALKIIILQRQQSEQPQTLSSRYSSPSEIQLHDSNNHELRQRQSQSPILIFAEECTFLLKEMQRDLGQLQQLVRRTGQSNDPTHDISQASSRLEQHAAQLSELLQPHLAAKALTQKQKHVHVMALQCQAVAQQYAEKLQSILKLRAKVLSQQQKRRQQFSSSNANSGAPPAAGGSVRINGSSNSSPSKSMSLQRNPLFAAKPLKSTANMHPQTNGNGKPSVAAGSNHYNSGISRTQNGGYYGGTASYGSSYGGGGYGGTPSSVGSGGGNLGMRRRPGAASQPQQQQTAVVEQEQFLVQQRVQERQSAQRLRDARQAEQALSQIGSLFGKMSSLVQQQGETLNKIEDDVEAASLDVQAGQDEITTLYSIKKGNRALILKVFGLLIFLIVFLRLYKK